MNFDLLKKIHSQRGQTPLKIKVGQTLEVHEKLGGAEGNRIWKFKGLVIKVKKPNETTGSFTMRGLVAGHTVEKIYPLSFARFEKVIKVDEFKVRRAKLYYIREKVGKDARMKSLLTADQRDEVLFDRAAEELKKAKAAPAPVEETPVVAPAPETEAEEAVEAVEAIMEAPAGNLPVDDVASPEAE